MPAVFVHGNPETPAIWSPLFTQLARRDVVALQLPGFGCARLDGFGATKDDYARWLEVELERLAADGPIDLVGHDWGGALVARVVSQRPELVRSWASDVLGLFSEGFVWHDFAQLWMTEGAGEQFFADFLAMPMADQVAAYVAMGIPEPTASEILAVTDDVMTSCVLALYRSATPAELQVWAAALDGARGARGLALRPTADPFTGGHDGSFEVVARLGVALAELDGCGHWWMLEQPALAATTLESFWAQG